MASNTAGQAIFYTNNDRNVNFNGNVVVDALCITDSIYGTNNATVGGTLNVTGAANFAINSSTYNGDNRLKVAHSLTNSTSQWI